jgi:hypothetical protein
MVAILLMRFTVGTVGLLPRSLHKALDAWSYRVALKRRDRRFRGAKRSAAHAK